MKRTLVTLSCVLSLAAGSAVAQQQQQSSGESLGDKAKRAAQAVGEKTKETTGKVLDKVEQTAKPAPGAQSGQGGTNSMGASGSSGSAPNDPQQMQKQADADLKSAKAQCETKQGQQKTICEKEAVAAHAQAEVAIEKAKVMGAGSSPPSK